MEGNLFHDLFRALQAEEGRTAPNVHPLFEEFLRHQDFGLGGGDIGIRQQRLHDGPLAAVFVFDGQATAPAAVVVGPIEGVEPVGRVVAIAVEGFRPQHFAARVIERHTLAKSYQAEAQALHVDALFQAGGRGHFELHSIEQGFVIVR